MFIQYQVVFTYDQVNRPHRSYCPSGGPTWGKHTTGGFACNCLMPETWTTEVSGQHDHI